MEQSNITISIQTNTLIELTTTITKTTTCGKKKCVNYKLKYIILKIIYIYVGNVTNEHKVTEKLKTLTQHIVNGYVYQNGILELDLRKSFTPEVLRNNRLNFNHPKTNNTNLIACANHIDSHNLTAYNMNTNFSTITKKPQQKSNFTTQSVQTNPWMKNASTSMNNLVTKPLKSMFFDRKPVKDENNETCSEHKLFDTKIDN
ncbi:uncharacterized protein LOC126906123 [Daktulosphaira vitifoliae]|uniref:uncharacterized protein LOC126906123 n=1 Tax=Daktulosphaira vitifoliae TaxID=58002 RepID=UPI0021AA5564|nr:uncharacterized protein LOC126906123 [Daktulosphaira vitifoliae]